MNKTVHALYQDYPEQPYISPDRDLDLWEKEPRQFPYQKVEKSQMQRLSEGILPGHIIMLWRIHFDNFTNQSVIPQYFEYRYGVDYAECLETLMKLGYIDICTAAESLDCLKVEQLKDILRRNNLPLKGRKADLLSRLTEHLPVEQLDKESSLRRYRITSSGTALLEKYDTIIRKHGPKS